MKYNPIKSLVRIEKIIDKSDTSFEDVKEIPPRSELTYNNGYYVNCSAIFIDIRSSSRLTDIHYRPKLAKLYRAYISEAVAILNGNAKCKEINVVGDCVSCLFDASSSIDIHGICCTAMQVSSLIHNMNIIFEKNDIKQIKIGIGISLGKALMIKAGYEGSGINDVVWMGDVVNEASNLCNHANKDEPFHEIMISESIYEKLNETFQNKFSYNAAIDCYQGNPYCTIIKECLSCRDFRNCAEVKKCDLYYTIKSLPED